MIGLVIYNSISRLPLAAGIKEGSTGFFMEKLMRRYKCLALVAAVVLLLTGCSGVYTGNDVSRFINPKDYGSVIPDEAPSAALPPEDSAKAKHKAEQPDTVYTVDMQWELKGGYFVGEEFSFLVPPMWRESFTMDADESGSGDMHFRTFNFYFFEEETQISVKLLRICVFTSVMTEKVGTLDGDEIGRSSDGGLVYARMSVRYDVPDEFQSGEALFAIGPALASEKLEFRVLV